MATSTDREATDPQDDAPRGRAAGGGTGASAPTDDAAFSRWLADRAGTALLTLRTQQGFADAAALKAAGDKRGNEVLLAALAQHRPGDAVLSEETEDSPTRQAARLAADRVWIVDPLDGTREYSEEGRTDWAVHVALWQRGAGDGAALTAGAVAMPARGLTLATDRPPVLPDVPDRPIRLAASRTRPPAFLAELAAAVGGELAPMGSAGVKVAAVVSGEVDAYVHAGGQHEWDSAAPVTVALATGLFASRVDGSRLDYNQPDHRLPDLVVCRPDLSERLLGALARLGVGRDGGTVARRHQ